MSSENNEESISTFPTDYAIMNRIPFIPFVTESIRLLPESIRLLPEPVTEFPNSDTIMEVEEVECKMSFRQQICGIYRRH